jgi:hypothetical protein
VVKYLFRFWLRLRRAVVNTTEEPGFRLVALSGWSIGATMVKNFIPDETLRDSTVRPLLDPCCSHAIVANFVRYLLGGAIS